MTKGNSFNSFQASGSCKETKMCSLLPSRSLPALMTLASPRTRLARASLVLSRLKDHDS